MPLYEYRCRACGADFERRLKFDQRLEPQSCPECGESRTALRLSAPAAVALASRAASSAPACPSTGEPCGCGRF